MIHLYQTQREGGRERGEKLARDLPIVQQLWVSVCFIISHHDDHCDHDEHGTACVCSSPFKLNCA